MLPENFSEGVDIPKFQAVSHSQVVMCLQRCCKASLVFSPEREVIFLAASDVRSNVNSGGVRLWGGISLMVRMILIKFVGQILSSAGGDDGE